LLVASQSEFVVVIGGTIGASVLNVAAVLYYDLLVIIVLVVVVLAAVD
jgi:hypothetical protein